MKKRTKWTALLCALCMAAAMTGCGGSEESSSESSAAETTTEATEAATEAAEESEEASEEASADETADNGEIDSEATMGTMTYRYGSQWVLSESESQTSYTMPDNSGALIFQLVDSSIVSSVAETEDEIVELLAEESQSAWDGIEGMEVVESGWNEELVPGKKCYIISYTYVISDITTTNTSVYFANFTEEAKDIFAVTATALTSDSTIAECLEEVLGSATFAE